MLSCHWPLLLRIQAQGALMIFSPRFRDELATSSATQQQARVVKNDVGATPVCSNSGLRGLIGIND